MRSTRWVFVFLVVLFGWRPFDSSAQYTPPAPTPICEICPTCAGCVRLCTAERQLTLSGVEINTGAAGSVAVDPQITIPQLMQRGNVNGQAPQCDCAFGGEVYFDSAGEDHTTGLTIEPIDGGGNARVRASMCTAENIPTVTRPVARCGGPTGPQAPFVVSLLSTPPAYFWDPVGIQEACLEGEFPCPQGYTYNGSGVCTAQSIDTSSRTFESQSWDRETRVGNNIESVSSAVAWSFPTSVGFPLCPNNAAPNAAGNCTFSHDPQSRYQSRAVLQSARGGLLNSEAPDFFGANATHTLVLPDHVVSHVGLPPPEGGSLTLAAAFPRIGIPLALRTIMLAERGALADDYAYIAFGDDVVEEARGSGSRPGGRPFNHLGTNAVHLLRDIRPAQFFETEPNACSPDTTYGGGLCAGEAPSIRTSHPSPSSTPTLVCSSGQSRSAVQSGGVQVGWRCSGTRYQPDSNDLDTDDETLPGTISVTYGYYPNATTETVRTYDPTDTEVRQLDAPTVIADTYQTQGCRHGFPTVIEDADTGNDITVCFTNGRFPPDDRYQVAGIVPSAPAIFEDAFPAPGERDTGYDPGAATPDGAVEVVRTDGTRLVYPMPR